MGRVVLLSLVALACEDIQPAAGSDAADAFGVDAPIDGDAGGTVDARSDAAPPPCVTRPPGLVAWWRAEVTPTTRPPGSTARRWARRPTRSARSGGASISTATTRCA